MYGDKEPEMAKPRKIIDFRVRNHRVNHKIQYNGNQCLNSIVAENKIFKQTKMVFNQGRLQQLLVDVDKENKLQEILDEENEDRLRQKEFYDRMRHMRSVSRDIERTTDTFGRQLINTNERQRIYTKQTTKSVNELQRQNIDRVKKESQMSFYNYKRKRRSILQL